MFRHPSRKQFIKILLLFCVVSAIAFFPVIYSLSDHLSKTARVKANVLVVEGWLQYYALAEAFKEFQNDEYTYIVTTGLKSPDYYFVGLNGYMIFYTKNLIPEDNEVREHKIEIDAYGQSGGKNSSLFNVYVNDSLIAGFSAETRKRKYAVTWKGKLTDIDSVMVQFLNDGQDKSAERNLYMKEVVIDNKITIPYQYHSAYDISGLDGKHKIINDFSSYAQLAKRRLLSMGLDSSRIIAVSGKRARINRTLTSALAFRDWLSNTNIEIKGINIVTLGTHAERTWMTYNRILKKSYGIGIISIPDRKDSNSRKHKILKTLRETFGLVYYWIILLPY
jgi:hypothetical protein